MGSDRAGASTSIGLSGEPRLVRVSLAHGLPPELLQREGFDLLELSRDHAVLLEWPGDAARLASLGLTAEVVDPAPARTAAARSRAELAARSAPIAKAVRSAVRPDGRFRTESLPPFGSGSMGGFWTSAEIKMKLDDLVASDADGVVAAKLDTIGWSWRGRPIWGLTLGKASAPAVFMNALTHAREPEGMQALFRFVDHIVGGYGTDPVATYLLDKRKLYIVPLVNPDGYAVNESLFVASAGAMFGMHRKNVRSTNGNSTFETPADGVDINRNYGFRWGKTNSGSSPTGTDPTYRGTSAFSEPENQAQRDIVAALSPKTALSFHSSGDLYLHPWGHDDSLTVDVAAFREWSDEMARNVTYETGSLKQVLYESNGDFGDWAYGDTLLKPRTFPWTPEIGHSGDGFWPPPSRIIPLADENLRACYAATAIAGPFVQAEALAIDEGAMNASYGAHLRVRARNLGVAATGALTGTLIPLDAGVQMLVSSVSYPALASRQSAESLAPFELAVDDTVTPGRMMRFAVNFTAPGGYFSRDTVSAPLGTATVLVADDASSGLGQWSPGTWGIVAGEPEHPSPFFADSPMGNYGFADNDIMKLLASVNITSGLNAYVTYQARWTIESYNDAALIEGSLDDISWAPLGGTLTAKGSGVGVQDLGLPLYAGTRWGWTREVVDLRPFAGAPALRLRFRVQDNGNSTRRDGFNFDSLRVIVFNLAAQPPLVAAGDPPAVARLELSAPAPNPVRDGAHFALSLARPGHARLEILDLQGRRIREIVNGDLGPGRHTLRWDGRDSGGALAAPGVYVARAAFGAESRSVRFAVVR